VPASTGHSYVSVGEEPRDHLWWAEILNLSKSDRAKFGEECVGVKRALEFLAGGCNPIGQGSAPDARRSGRRFHRIGIIEHDVGVSGQTGNEFKRRVDRGLGEIGYDPKPGEKRRLIGIESPAVNPEARDSRSKSTGAKINVLGIGMEAAASLSRFQTWVAG
jgi:hypothetical protein